MRSKGLAIGLVAIAAFSPDASAQDDETRQASGLPIMIGENVARGNQMNISGRITLDFPVPPKRMPNISVYALQSSMPTARTFAVDSGHYLIRNVPRDILTVVVEIDGIEAARQQIVAPPMGNPRQDFSIRWDMATGARQQTGVVDASSYYSRTEKNEELFTSAKNAVRMGDQKRAYTIFNQILAADPKDFPAWTETGTLLFNQKAYDNAEACYFKALQLKKNYFPALMNLGKLYLSQKKADDAILVLSSAVKSDPSSSDAHFYLAESFLLNRKGGSAELHFLKAIEIAPMQKSEVHLRLASIYIAADQKKKAVEQYRSFLKKQPDFVERARLEDFIKTNS